jgi:hypothetical protein
MVSPATTYTYSIGSGGAAVNGGVSGHTSGAGGTGFIVIDECYS